MPLQDIVNMVVTAAAASPTQPSFGVPLIAAYTTVFAGRTQEYSSLVEMTTAGFTVNSGAYKAAAAIFSQKPAPASIKIGRRALVFTQSFHLTALSAVTGDVYSFTLVDSAGVSHPISYTVPGSSTTTTVATAIAALINAASVAGLASCTSSAAIITLTSNAGVLLDYLSDPAHLTFADNTSDPGIATDLAAIYAADNAWYGLLLDSNGTAEVESAASWAESNGPHLFGYNSTDAACGTSSTSDVMSTLQAASDARVYGLYAQSQLLCYSAAAWMGNQFPFAPGSTTWAYKTLQNVPVDSLTTTQVHNICGNPNAGTHGKNGNVYTQIAGINVTQYGVTASGEFIDVTQFIDWLQATMQLNIFAALANARKIPFTDAGGDVIYSEVDGTLQQGITAGGLAASPAPIVVTPKVASIDALDVNNRNFTPVTFQATLAGAIHSLTINGTVVA